MAYVGTPLDTTNAFQSLSGKRFSGDGSTTDFTLDSAPNSTLDIEVFVGNVRQDPNSAYTVSGTTLGFTGAPPSGTNNIYVVHQAKAVGTISIPDDTISSQTDIGGAIADADLFLIDDGGGGTIRKTAASRLSTYISPSTATDTFTINGSTPTLTIGDAVAEDTKIVFDGNAQDFHIGLDDSADDLVIGLGSTLGTTSHIVIDEAGHITKPLQSMYLADVTSQQTNVTGDETTYDIVFGADVIDRNADHAHATGVFTAPVDGMYLFNLNMDFSGVESNHTRMIVYSNASNRNVGTFVQNIDDTRNSASFGIGSYTMIHEMDASDTHKFQVRVDGGSKTLDMNDTTFAQGFLIG